MPESMLLSQTGKLSRQELALIPTPVGTDTHRPIPHVEVVQSVVQGLDFRHIQVVRDEYAVDKTGMKLWGVLDLDAGMEGAQFSIGLRNSHDKSMRLSMVVGLRVTVCFNGMFKGDFQPVMAKHSKKFNLQDAIAVGLDRMQRGFEPMKQLVDQWRGSEISDTIARLTIYRAFVEDGLAAPKHLARIVHHHYFEPEYEDFQPRTMWSLTNAFTSAFKTLDPIPAYKATAKLGPFLNAAQ
jgi:hypothetical protein